MFHAAVNGSIVMYNDYNGTVLATEITHSREHSDDFDRWRVMHNNLPRDEFLL